MKTQKQEFVFKSSYYMNNIITGNMIQVDAEQNTATTFGCIMALLFITIRIDNISFDDGSQQILRVFSSRSRISLL